MNLARALSLSAILFVAAAQPSHAAESPGDTLSFEVPGPAGELVGWSGFPAGTIFPDSAVVHGGRFAARIERGRTSPRDFSALSRSIPVGVTGDTLELSGWLKLDDVRGFAGLWLREDASSGTVQFDNMQEQELEGTAPWAEYRISLPLDKRAKTILFGALLAGRGTVRVDDLTLRVDGKPIADAPALIREPTAVETDHEFDGGSRIEATALSAEQIENLVLLGKVWGFLKYHHPRVTAARLHWDYELFRVMPFALMAEDRAEATRVLSRWLASIGEPEPCNPCATFPDSAYLLPRIEWIGDREQLGEDLSARLRRIHVNRDADEDQYYVSLTPGVRNPDFSSEAGYAKEALPDAGYRLLALFRFWNMIEYWFPYRDLITEDWDGVLAEFLPRLMAAATEDEYRLAMIELVACVHDGHANVWSAVALRPPRGDCQLPVAVRPVEGRYVVGEFSDSLLGLASGLEIGDAILKIDGLPVDSLATAWAPYYGSSNAAARQREIGRSLTKGSCGACRVSIERGGKRLEVTATRDSTSSMKPRAGLTHDLPGETFRLLSKDVAYLKLSSVVAADAASYLERAAGTKCFVIDIRNYPSDFVPFALGQHLVEQPTAFTRFTRGDLTNPGAFLWTDPLSILPALPHYGGAIVILVDETTQSSAEYTAMGLRAAPNAIVVGSTTAGADGNVSAIPLPGGLRAMISGIGVFYPDKTPTQRVGIVPDLVVRPTVKGIRAGRDEVLEAALKKALGRDVRVPMR